MHPLQNGSQTTEAPAKKNPVGTAGFFTESGENGAPSYPGADWFNANIKEFMNALSASGVDFDPDRFDHFAQMLAANGSQMAPWRSDRIYKQNETCTTFNAVTGELEVWTSYAPSDNTGNDPQDPTNRHEQWQSFPEPFWWIKHHAVEPGTPVYWFSDDIPENALQIMDTDIDAGFYHRLANAYPSLVADGKINLADILGRYIRIADGVDYLVNTTHEDATRKITGEFSQFILQNGITNVITNGAFTRNTRPGDALTATTSTQTTVGDDGVGFDSSLVVPTASQNQPKSTMANLIIFI